MIEGALLRLRALRVLFVMMKGDVTRQFLYSPRASAKLFRVFAALALALGSNGCFSDEGGGAYYGRIIVPRRQEFRWSDGGVPKIFDPSRASAPPDTDAVRALFEGLTEYDTQTLRPAPAVASRWESSADRRVWTFYLREEARWSNGDPVTAHDFLRSWQRTLRLGDFAPHSKLLANLEERPKASAPRREAIHPQESARGHEVGEKPTRAADDLPRQEQPALAAEALGERILRVRLQHPDKNLPALLAHPVFRPVHTSALGKSTPSDLTPTADIPGEGAPASAQLVSNGAFRLGEYGDDKVVLERDQHYWNAAQVALERVRFVGARDAEAALASYRAGELDAVTNVNVEPAGLKLLASYEDFRRTTFAALTYYDFNTTRPPFDDLRVRQALALSVDRRRLSADTLEGATEPAEKFLPVHAGTDGGKDEDASLGYDPARAQRLLAEAGYPAGAGFPRIRLLVNRNDQHRMVAQSVAAMWRSVLEVETEVVLLDWDEYETRLRVGGYDVAKRSILFQTTDEETNLRAMFDPHRLSFDAPEAGGRNENAPPSLRLHHPATQPEAAGSGAELPHEPITTEAQALKEIPAIPLYFASSLALVKPYVQGFETNMLDAPSLQRVRLATDWQPPKHELTASFAGN